MTTTRRHHDEAGFTLLELLIVTLIIGVLASIAIPSFLGSRDRAWHAAVTSDVRATVIAMETASDQGSYPDEVLRTASTALLGFQADPTRLYSVALSPGVSVDVTTAGDRYCVCGFHERLGEAPAVIYDSQRGTHTDECELDGAPVCAVPPLLAAQTFSGLVFAGTVCDADGCVHGQQGGANNARVLLGGPEGGIAAGTLTLTDVTAEFGASGGGWGIGYGSYGEDHRMIDGYTVQFDRGLNQFVVRQWSDGREGHRLGTDYWQFGDQGIDFRGSDTLHHDRVDLDVRDGRLRLTVDGRDILEHPIGDVDGSFAMGDFGLRNWTSTTVRYGDASLTVD